MIVAAKSDEGDDDLPVTQISNHSPEFAFHGQLTDVSPASTETVTGLLYGSRLHDGGTRVTVM